MYSILEEMYEKQTRKQLLQKCWKHLEKWKLKIMLIHNVIELNFKY